MPEKKDKKELTLIERMRADDFKNAIAAVVPSGYSVDRHIVTAVDSVIKNLKDAQNLVPSSVLNAVYLASSMGLSFEPQKKEAYLVGFNCKIGKDADGYDIKGVMVTLIAGYKGLQKLCKNAGMKNMTAKVIFDDDDFTYEEIDGEVSYSYTPSFSESRGNPKCVLTVAFMEDGSKDVRVLPYYKVTKIKNAAKSKNIWANNEDEMAEKTAIRRHCNQLPQSFDNPNLATMVKMEELSDAGNPQFDTPKGMEELVDSDYQEIADKVSKPSEKRESTKPEVSQPVVEGDFEEVKTPNMDKLIKITGQSLEEIAIVLENEFKITDIESVDEKKLSSIVDVFMGKE